MALSGKGNNERILDELEFYFKRLPDYIKQDRNFKNHHDDIFTALQDIYPKLGLYDIITFLNSKGFKQLKEKTDQYIKKEGLEKAIEDAIKNPSEFISVSLFDTKNETDMVGMFLGSQFNHPLNLWNVSSVENMAYMFGDSKYNHPINNWDVSSVTDMEGIFEGSLFNHPLNDWDVSSVEDKSYMFLEPPFNGGPLRTPTGDN